MEGSGIGQFIPLILIFVIFYFFLIRPQQKKVKEHKAMVESLKKGDKIVTTGGITGTITRVVDNDKIEVEISENVTVPVIASGGAGKPKDIVDVVLKSGVSAVLAASIFHFGIHSISSVKIRSSSRSLLCSCSVLCVAQQIPIL